MWHFYWHHFVLNETVKLLCTEKARAPKTVYVKNVKAKVHWCLISLDNLKEKIWHGLNDLSYMKLHHLCQWTLASNTQLLQWILENKLNTFNTLLVVWSTQPIKHLFIHLVSVHGCFCLVQATCASFHWAVNPTSMHTHSK